MPALNSCSSVDIAPHWGSVTALTGGTSVAPIPLLTRAVRAFRARENCRQSILEFKIIWTFSIIGELGSATRYVWNCAAEDNRQAVTMGELGGFRTDKLDSSIHGPSPVPRPECWETENI